MSDHTLLEDFLSSDPAASLKERDLLIAIVRPLPGDSPVLYDLTFHAAFAKRIFDIIKREGPHTQGFDRMQQSFFESVEKIKAILATMHVEDTTLIAQLTSSTPEAKARLSRFIEDLALLKNWILSTEKK